MEIKNEYRVSHKELLTLTNISCLDWQYVELHDKVSGKKKNNVFIKNLLKPGSFVRYDSDNDMYSYPYIKNKTDNQPLTKEEHIKGLAEMRKEAGIAMEYLEKLQQFDDESTPGGSEEGRFLEDWEVIYGADNYKIVQDFYDDLLAAKCDMDPAYNRMTEDEQEEYKKEKKKDLYPTREKIENKQRWEKRFKIVSKCISIGLQIVPLLIQLRFADEYMQFKTFDLDDAGNVAGDINNSTGLRMLKQIDGAITTELQKKAQIFDYIKMLEGSAEHWALGLFNYPTNFAKRFSDQGSNALQQSMFEDVDQAGVENSGQYHIYNKEFEDLKEYEQFKEAAGSISFIKKLNMADTGFRVTAFRRNTEEGNKQIIIAYTKKKVKNGNDKILPEEFDLLKIVHAKLIHENSNCTIHYVGYNEGGEYAFLNSLLYDEDATLFLTKKPVIHDYVDFTYHDLDKDYKDNYEIVHDGFTKIATDVSIELVSCFLLSSGAIPGVVFIVGYGLLSIYIEYLKKENDQKMFNYLKDNGFINLEYSNGNTGDERAGKKVVGYVTEKFDKDIPLSIKLDNGEKINVKLEDALFIKEKIFSDAYSEIKREKDGNIVFINQGNYYELGEIETEQINSIWPDREKTFSKYKNEIVDKGPIYEIKSVVFTSLNNSYNQYSDIELIEVYLPSDYPKSDFERDYKAHRDQYQEYEKRYEEYKKKLSNSNDKDKENTMPAPGIVFPQKIELDNVYESKYKYDNRPDEIMSLWHARAEFDNNPYVANKGKQIFNIMKIMSYLQSAYLNQTCNLEYILYRGIDKDYDQEQKLQILKHVPRTASLDGFKKTIEDLDKKFENISDFFNHHTVYNEFVFMPYIDSESGNIEEDLKLNRNYIGSVIKSAVQTYMWKHCKGYLPGDTAYCFVYDNVEDARKACQQMIDNSSRTVRLSNPMGVIGELISKKVVKEMNENDIIKKKYGLENSFPTQYMCYFEDNIKESILILMERSEVCKKKINHYEYILDRLREGKSEEYKLENYIKTKDAANQSWLTLDKIITLNPDADNNIEYKYNPDDFIIGNKIELSTIVLEEKIEMATDLISAGISAALIKTEEFIDVLTEYSAQSWDFLKEEGGEIIDESRDYLETSYQDLKEGIEILPEKLAPYQKQINDYRSSIKGEAVRFISSLSEKTKNIIQELPDSREINENFRNLIKRVYDLDILKDAATIVTDLDNQLSSQKPFRAVIHEDQDLKEVIINYSTGDEENIISRLCLAAGLPNEDFARAEIVYRMKVKEDRKNGKNDNSYSLQGHTLGGALAAYAGIMSDAYMSAFSPEDGSDQDPESEVNENKSSSSRTNYQVINLNGMGPGNFLDFRGNEFFGYKIGIYYFLEKELNQNYTPDTILYELIERGVIVNGNISNEFRKNVGQNLNVEKMKRVLVEIVHDVLPFELADAEEFVLENFNPLIIERKMRFVESYRKYQARVGDGIDNIINYITSDCFPARLMKQVGASYIVDQKLKQLDPHIDEGFLKRAMMIKQSELEGLINPKLDLFQPFMHLIPSVLQKAENRLREKAVIGNMTDSLSLDYLSSLVKDIICDLKSKDQDILKKLFRYHRLQSPLAMLEVIKDRLRHSMRLQKRIYDDDSIYKSSYFKENLDLFTEEDKIYSLAAAALEQLDKRMSFIELDQLYKWELTGQGIELVLCGQEDDENNKGGNSSNDNTSGSGDSKNSSKMEITYHSSDSAQKFDNKEKRLKIECDQPSANRIYGSVKKGRYIEKRDNEYLCKDNHIYQFNNTQGTGFEILSAYTKVDSKIKVDGQDIDNVYQEKDREEADIGSRIKTLQDTYFGDNIILRNKERLYDQLTGDLIYIYGPGKKDQLTIEGFENGDYGIELKEKAKEKSDNRELHTYTDYKIKIDPFEFVILDHFEIKRELYEHTEVFIKGAVRKEDAGRYFKTLLQEDVEIEITYDNDDRNILFKGIIEKFDFSHDYQNYYLELKARSCSVLLERRRPNRIFQNQGTSYNQVFSKLMEDNTEFNIAFADSSTGDTPLISEDYPLVLQYKESEWDFIKRLSSYMQQVVIVDDTKNKQEKINIQAGYHKNSVARDLNNISGSESRKTGKKNTKYKYYRVEDHQHYRSDNIFQVGKKVNYRLNNSSDDKVELVIIKNRIHIKNQRLCSDFTLVREEDVNLLKTLRERPIEGSGFRAEVVQVNNKYQVKVRFLEIDDDFMEDKAHWFPMDQIYTTAFFAPEVGDIVDIYFKGRNEKYASMKSSTSDEERVIDHNPVDKLIRTPENYRLKLNNEGILFASNKDKSVMDLKEKDTTLNSNKSRIKLEVDKISLNCKKSTAVVDGKKIQLAFGGKGIKVSNGKINMS